MSIFWVQFILVLGPVLIVPLAISGEFTSSSSSVRKIIGFLASALFVMGHLTAPGWLAGLFSMSWLCYTFYLFGGAYFSWKSEGREYTLEWRWPCCTASGSICPFPG